MIAVSITSSLAQWSQETLPTARYRMGATALGSKVYFAGGTSFLFSSTNIIDIYDFNTGLWTTANLSATRDLAAGYSVGSKVFFAGGVNFNNSTVSDVVDIYDSTTNQWTSAQLSVPRFGIGIVSDGNNVLFAGGVGGFSGPVFDVVDVYNIATGTWSTTNLSEARGVNTAAVSGSKAIFAGGYDAVGGITNKVDIYDFSTQTWATSILSQARGFAAAAAVGDKIYIGGGMIASNTPTNRVDIYDVSTGTWSIDSLSAARAWMDNAVTANGNVVFAGGAIVDFSSNSWGSPTGTVDIYNPATGVWSVTSFNGPVILHSNAASMNHVLVAGGLSGNVSNAVHIYTFPVSGINESNSTGRFKYYPNPVTDMLNVTVVQSIANTVLRLYNVNGELLSEQKVTNNTTQIDVSKLEAGLYIIKLQSNEGVEIGKLIKQ